MSAPGIGPPIPELDNDPRWALALRVADSPSFRTCPKLRAFLLYVCRNGLLGRPEELREQLVGTCVFGRPDDYNIGDDNIVRVEARELRKRLESYFAGEGAHEPLVIEIPKGRYLPAFQPRGQSAPPPPEPEPAASSAPGRRPLVWLAGGLVLCAAAAIWFGFALWRLEQRPEVQAALSARSALESHAFYRELLGLSGEGAQRETLLVLSNPRVVLFFGADRKDSLDTVTGTVIPAPPQLRTTFPEGLNNIDRDLPLHFLQATREDYTGMGEAVAAFHVSRLMQILGHRVRLTQGRFLTWDQVQKQNLILLGSEHINDWTFQNVGKSNFNIDLHGMQNQQPLPGEQAHYVTARSQGGFTDYGVIKRLASPGGVNMVILAGRSSTGTAGVGQFFTDPEKMRPAYERIRAAAPGKPFPSSWEALLKVDVRDGLPVDTTAIAFRPAR
jgi:hypothetical protein